MSAPTQRSEPQPDWLDRLWAAEDLAPSPAGDKAPEEPTDTPAKPKKAKAKGAKGGKKRGKKKGKSGAKEPVSRFAQAAANPRLRWLAYNASAAALGHSLVWGVTGDPMAGADLMSRATISLVPLGVTAAVGVAGYAGWRAGGVASGLLPGTVSRAARPAGALAAALWAQGTGPLLTQTFAALHPWPVLLAPLLLAAGAGVLCWWALDRRCATWRPATRWVARVPLATVVLSSALYAPGAVL
ncbi:hypothetical protein ACFYVL_44295 [Streptomyces sp. NPDC004111]|uniref:hypothetical protein n=1 Tax=Streptomyces sp. NPDC004111 TaxID=3364690 RepID=UPI0036C6C5B7